MGCLRRLVERSRYAAVLHTVTFDKCGRFRKLLGDEKKHVIKTNTHRLANTPIRMIA